MMRGTKACNGMMALRTACVNPSSLQPYIRSLTGGKDNSPEGLQVSPRWQPPTSGLRGTSVDEMLTDGLSQHGATHGFVSAAPVLLSRNMARADLCVGRAKVVEFASTQDRDYYVSQDPAHQKLKKSISSLVDSVVVVDWENGQF